MVRRAAQCGRYTFWVLKLESTFAVVLCNFSLSSWFPRDVTCLCFGVRCFGLSIRSRASSVAGKLCGTAFCRCASGTCGHRCCTLALSRQCPSHRKRWRTIPCRTLLANPSMELLRSGACSVPWLRRASVTSRVRRSLLHKIHFAVDHSGRPLPADRPNIWMHTAALDALYDVRAILDRQRSAEQAKELRFLLFQRLVSADVDDWDLSSPGTLQSTVSHGCFWSRAFKDLLGNRGLTDVFGFWITSFSLASHAVAHCFKDTHLSLA